MRYDDKDAGAAEGVDGKTLLSAREQVKVLLHDHSIAKHGTDQVGAKRVWDRLQRDMAKHGGVIQPEGRRRKTISSHMWMRAAAAMLVVAAPVALYFGGQWGGQWNEERTQREKGRVVGADGVFIEVLVRSNGDPAKPHLWEPIGRQTLDELRGKTLGVRVGAAVDRFAVLIVERNEDQPVIKGSPLFVRGDTQEFVGSGNGIYGYRVEDQDDTLMLCAISGRTSDEALAAVKEVVGGSQMAKGIPCLTISK